MRVADGIRMVVSCVILQAAPSLKKDPDQNVCHVGYTTTKKLGSAVVRNRIRRRLRAAVQEVFPSRAKRDMDYVLIGRYKTISCSFDELKGDLKWALKKANIMMAKGITKSPPPTRKKLDEESDDA